MDCFATRTDSKTVRLIPVSRDSLKTIAARGPRRQAAANRLKERRAHYA